MKKHSLICTSVKNRQCFEAAAGEKRRHHELISTGKRIYDMKGRKSMLGKAG